MSASEPSYTRTDTLYSISCLLADIDDVAEQLESRFHFADVSKLKDMLDELTALVDRLAVPSDDDTPDLLDDECPVEVDQSPAPEHDPSDLDEEL